MKKGLKPFPKIYSTPSIPSCYESYIKEAEFLRKIYQEIKEHNLRKLLGTEEEIQDFIDTIIDKVYRDDTLKRGKDEAKRKDKQCLD